MLILSRKENQTIIVDGIVTIHIANIRGNRVSVGVECAPEVKVLRGELECQQGSDGKDKGGRTANQ